MAQYLCVASGSQCRVAAKTEWAGLRQFEMAVGKTVGSRRASGRRIEGVCVGGGGTVTASVTSGNLD